MKKSPDSAPTSRVNRSALSTTREQGEEAFLPRPARRPSNSSETRGVVENGRRVPGESGIKGRFYLSTPISLFARIDARIRARDFAVFRRHRDIPSGLSFQKPSSPNLHPRLSLSLAPISLIFRVVGKGEVDESFYFLESVGGGLDESCRGL